jgi:cell wall assembly regulator SMI1
MRSRQPWRWYCRWIFAPVCAFTTERSGFPPGSGQPSPVPPDYLYDTDQIVEETRLWRDNHAADRVFDDPRVWAYQVDRANIGLNRPVRPIVGSAGAVLVGDMNGDVHWFLDLDPAPGGTPGQVVRVDVECSSWDVLAPSWTQLLVRYAEDLHLYATNPDSATLVIDQDLGPECEWGSALQGAPQVLSFATRSRTSAWILAQRCGLAARSMPRLGYSTVMMRYR